MDYKQKKIFNKILEKFKLSSKNKFIQHRNLKEFKYFEIERINPNHRIFLYGRLKKQYAKHKGSLHLIKVGEIIIYSSLFLLPCDNIFTVIFVNFILYFLICSTLFEILLENKILGFDLNVDRYRRKYWLRKNSLCS